MRIESIHLRNFKRFTDLKIQNISAMAKLVVLLGPNGCGKSSLFDALHYIAIVDCAACHWNDVKGILVFWKRRRRENVSAASEIQEGCMNNTAKKLCF